MHNIFGTTPLSWKRLIRTVIVSISLTILFYFLTYFSVLEGRNAVNVISSLVLIILILLIPLNIIFDYLTLLVMLWALQIVSTKKWYFGCIALLMDIIISFVFSLLLVFLPYYFMSAMMILDGFLKFYEEIMLILFLGTSVSIFLPVIIFSSIIMLFMIIKFLLIISKQVGLHLIELTTESEEGKIKFFTIITSVFSILILFAKFIDSM